MKTHDVELLLGINKETLRYYEKADLIRISKDQNGYRNYNEEDIRLLKNILFFRSMHLSIEEIKQILNNEISLNAVLSCKQETLKKEIRSNQNILDMINKNLQRKKAYYGVNQIDTEYQHELYVLLCDDEVIIKNSEKEIYHYSYKDISSMSFSICTRAYTKNIRESGQLTFYSPYLTVGLPSYFFVDLDIKIKNGTFSFESINLDNIKEIFDCLSKHEVTFNDPLNLNTIFHSAIDAEHLQKQLLSHVKKWEKDYHIDNPRSIDTVKLVQKAHEKISHSKTEQWADPLVLKTNKILLRVFIGLLIFYIGFHLLMILFKHP